MVATNTWSKVINIWLDRKNKFKGSVVPHGNYS